jgi:hypothetical protein
MGLKNDSVEVKDTPIKSQKEYAKGHPNMWWSTVQVSRDKRAGEPWLKKSRGCGCGEGHMSEFAQGVDWRMDQGHGVTPPKANQAKGAPLRSSKT